MALCDLEVRKQVKQMMAFIEQEANEKVEEIDAKSEEEFNIEKGRLAQQQRLKLSQYYAKKEKQVELQNKVLSSNALNQGRLKILKEREDRIASIIKEARRRLGQITENKFEYKCALEKLILQALYLTMEPHVILRCRQVDMPIVCEAIPCAVEEYRKNLCQNVEIEIDTSCHLPAEDSGGIELIALNGRVKVPNTLESRLELITHQLLPNIRNALFGRNPNRKFID